MEPDNEKTSEKIAVRLPKKHLSEIDYLIDNHEYGSRSEVIRHAIKEFLEHHIPQFTEKLQKMQSAKSALNQIKAQEEAGQKIEQKYLQK